MTETPFGPQPVPKASEEQRRRRKRRTRVLVVLIGLGLLGSAVGIFVLRTYERYRIVSEAMLPTLQVGDRVMTTDGDVEIGDIAVFNPPLGSETGECGAPGIRSEMCALPTPRTLDVQVIMRVVAGPGDRVALDHGKLVRNGRVQREDYAAPCRGPSSEHCNLPFPVRIPSDHFLVLGDNRGFSDDSRFWGPIPRSSIRGRVVFRYWPPSRWGSP